MLGVSLVHFRDAAALARSLAFTMLWCLASFYELLEFLHLLHVAFLLQQP